MKDFIKNLKFISHQINSEIGNIEGNTNKIINELEIYKNERNIIHIFPETAITGYLCGSLYDRLDFVKESQESFDKIVDYIKLNIVDAIVILGNIRFIGLSNAGFPILKNSAFIINTTRGKFYVDYYDKQLLANGDHHEDRKYFREGDETKIFNVSLNGINFKIGTPVCEDCWYVDHTRNIPEEMVKLGADLLITINQSYFYIGKQLIKYNMFSTIAKHNNVPVIMVNSVGCGDIVKNFVSYPGGSMFFNDNGKMISNQPLFQEHTLKFDFNSKFKLYDWNLYKYEEILQDLLYVQKEIFRVQGISKAQVHCSGGLDSAVVSYIVTKAMGTTNTILISNPSLCNGDETKSNAQYIADKLKCNLYWEPIEDMYQSIKTTDEKAFNDSVYEQKKTALSSMQAVGRTVLGLAASIRFNSAIVCTSNLTELCLGWYSFHDIGSVGILQLISDLNKVEVFKLAEYINQKEKDIIIPERLYKIDGMKPLAELPDANEDGIDYWVVSGICAEFIRERKCVDDIIFEYENDLLNDELYPVKTEVYKYNIIDFKNLVIKVNNLIKKNVYKLAQSAPGVILNNRSRGFSSREVLLNKYNK